MGTRAVERGPVAKRVAENVRALRGRVTVRELSERLAKAGRPILPSGVVKIEQGDRRVDVDDLVALALALDVTPNRLLLTEGASMQTQIDLVPDLTISEDGAWAWATGDVLIAHEYAGDVTTPEYANIDNPHGIMERIERFVRVNRPHDPRDTTDMRKLVPHKGTLRKLAQLVEELEEAGVPRQAAYRYVDLYGEEGKEG